MVHQSQCNTSTETLESKELLALLKVRARIGDYGVAASSVLGSQTSSEWLER